MRRTGSTPDDELDVRSLPWSATRIGFFITALFCVVVADIGVVVADTAALYLVVARRPREPSPPSCRLRGVKDSDSPPGPRCRCRFPRSSPSPPPRAARRRCARGHRRVPCALPVRRHRAGRAVRASRSVSPPRRNRRGHTAHVRIPPRRRPDYFSARFSMFARTLPGAAEGCRGAAGLVAVETK